MPRIDLTRPDPPAADPTISDRLWHAALPETVRGQWCRIRLAVPRVPLTRQTGLARLLLDGPGLPAQEAFATRACPFARPGALVLIPPEADRLGLHWLGPPPAWARLAADITPLSRRRAGIALALRHPFRLVGLLAGALRGGRAGLARRLRAGFAALAEAGGSPASYRRWIALFDTWPTARHMALAAAPDRADWPGVAALLFAADPASRATRATRAALAAQSHPVPIRRIAPGEPWPTGLPDDIVYLALVQAGDILPPRALALLAGHACRGGMPPFLYADEDALRRSGRRHAPLFKPQPGRPLMLSGTLARGVWLVRRDLLDLLPGAAQAAAGHAPWAEAARLELWLRAHEAGIGPGIRVPYILTHRRHDAEAAPQPILAAIVAAHGTRTQQVLHVAPEPWPLRVAPELTAPARVSVIVPSAFRAPHVLRCLTGVLDRTEGVSFELRLVHSDPAPPDAAQQALLARLGADPRVVADHLPASPFSYAAANNGAAARTDAPFLCLLNDDVLPLSPRWLAAMLGHMADPTVGIVGARLFYPDLRTQHGGVLMGVGGISDHMNRFLPRRAAGYAHRGRLSQDLSAVTGACLLIRREVFAALGGLDPNFPVLYNDADLCLRARDAGHRVVIAAEAELIHYESLSLGHHFAGPRAALQAGESARMRTRHAAAIAADPFHNPNLSQRRGQEWSLAFPPRLTDDLP